MQANIRDTDNENNTNIVEKKSCNIEFDIENLNR